MNVEREERPTSEASSENGTMKKRKWKLRLVEKQPSPICSNDTIKTAEEHRLSDDAVVHSSKETETIEDLEEMHECLWKRMFLEEQRERGVREGGEDQNCGVKGISVVLHFEGRDDFVFRGELSSGGQLRAIKGQRAEAKGCLQD
jgi:hypothetical protein